MTVAVDAVIYSRIFDATMSIINVEDAHASTKLLAATTLRNVMGTKTLSEILSDREQISNYMQVQYTPGNRHNPGTHFTYRESALSKTRFFVIGGGGSRVFRLRSDLSLLSTIINA